MTCSMTIKTYPPLSFTKTGQRPNNEDRLFPLPGDVDEQTRLFLVCDGMGGADKGEIASQLVAQQMAEYVTTRQELVLDDQHLEQALVLVGEALKAYIRANSLVNRMGSTLALLQLHQQGATIAHLGDSRVFQIRNGEIIFQTKDHKQVNDMVEAGIITAHQAKTHPWRNRLSRAAMVTSMDLQNPNYQVDMPDEIGRAHV